MILKDISLPTPQANIAFDEDLLSLAEHSSLGEVLRFWESEDIFAVLGRTSKPKDDVFLKNVVADHIPVLRRCSGGGTVLKGKGCLNYALILSKDLRPEVSLFKESYRFILGNMVQALKQLGIAAVYRPISDLAL